MPAVRGAPVPVGVTVRPRLRAPGPDDHPRPELKAPAVNNSFSVTCQGPAASSEVLLGQGRFFTSAY